jgi:soluble lytic murein transglycosylase-like protein
MSIIDAINRNTREKKDIKELAKLPQVLIMQMGQRKDLSPEEVAMVISAKADMIDQAAKQAALAQSGGGQLPSVMEQNMMKIAQSENPAPQQPMPQQMAQAPQLPEDVGIAQNPVPPMQMAGGGIIAFDEGGGVDIDPEDEYQELLDQAQEDETNQNIFDLIAEMGSGANVGIRSGENKNITQDTRERAMDSTGDLVDRLRAQIMQKESGGRRYDKDGNLLTSSKGALGEMQVMPATARDPGFGIKPARDNSPDELRRVGDEYASILLNRYQDPKLAMIAYNMGPGATDKWLASGADIRKLPKETQGYIRGVNLAEGGEVKRFQVGGTMSGFDDAYTDVGIPLTRPEIDEYTIDPRTGEKLFSGYRGKSKAKEPKKEVKKADDAETEQFFSQFQTAPAPAAAPPAANTPQAKAEEETFNLMKYIRDRQARADKLAESDKWQAGLAAGLGMLGGTSQYAFENIGKGGQLGVQQLGQLQKLRATQDIAGDKMLGTAYNAEVLGKLRKDQLAQGNSVRYANALNSVREERVKQTGKYLEKPEYMDLGMLQTYAQRLAKNPNDKEAKAKYDSLLTKKQSLENKIKRDLPDPDPTLYGVSGGSNSMKIVGVR